MGLNPVSNKKGLLTLFCVLLFYPTNLDHQLHQNCLKTLVDLSDCLVFFQNAGWRLVDVGIIFSPLKRQRSWCWAWPFISKPWAWPCHSKPWAWPWMSNCSWVNPCMWKCCFWNCSWVNPCMSKCCTWPSMSNCSWVHPCDARMSNCSHSSMAKRCWVPHIVSKCCVSKCWIHGCLAKHTGSYIAKCWWVCSCHWCAMACSRPWQCQCCACSWACQCCTCSWAWPWISHGWAWPC